MNARRWVAGSIAVVTMFVLAGCQRAYSWDQTPIQVTGHLAIGTWAHTDHGRTETIEIRADHMVRITGFARIEVDRLLEPEPQWADSAHPPVDAVGIWRIERLYGWLQVATVSVDFDSQPSGPLPIDNALISYDDTVASSGSNAAHSISFSFEALHDVGGRRFYIGFGDPDSGTRLYFERQSSTGTVGSSGAT